MRVFVDESGTFGWTRPAWSVIAAIGVAEHDGALGALVSRLIRWERGLSSKRREGGEVKGRLLTDDELAAFVDTVLDRDRAKNHVTLCGFDSSRTSRAEVARFRARLATGASPQLLRYAASHNRRMAQTARELIGWVGGRSEEQVAWLLCLQAAFAHALQHAVIALMNGPDQDLADLRFIVDRSWIHNRRHVEFWHALVVSGLNERSREVPLLMPNDWPSSHAFRRAYDRDRGLDVRGLWSKTTFARSNVEPGVRVADVIAHIALRHYRHGKATSAFARLERLVMGERGTLLHGILPTVLTPEAFAAKYAAPAPTP